jgi:biotin carboxylase
MMKKIMQLGANFFQTTVIKAAKELGHYVITVDYLPDNPGHKFSDEYHNISTVDKEGVLKLAQELKIDGIISYASDVSANTAAYVAERMGLPTNPYESVNLMTHKELTRPFLEKHGFNVPVSKGFENIDDARIFFKSLDKPAMIKPSDSAGSKGASRVAGISEFDTAFEKALSFSRQKIVIVEEFINYEKYLIDGDFFLLNGDFAFDGFLDSHRDTKFNPFVPVGLSYPSIMSDKRKKIAKSELLRFLNLLNMKFGAFNSEFAFDKDDNFYIIEIGPRSGGNLIPDAILAATGVDLAKAVVNTALGLDSSDFLIPKYSKCAASYILHSNKSGILKSISVEKIKNDIKMYLKLKNIGDKVERFENSACAIGAMVINFKSLDEMCYRMDNMEKFVIVEVN